MCYLPTIVLVMLAFFVLLVLLFKARQHILYICAELTRLALSVPA